MSVRMRELRQEVQRCLEDKGIENIIFDMDGAGHQIAKFHFYDKSMRFHFPATTDVRGHARLNILGDLKRRLRAAEPRQTEPTEITLPAKPARTPRRGDRERLICEAVSRGEKIAVVSMAHCIGRKSVRRILRSKDAGHRRTPATPVVQKTTRPAKMSQRHEARNLDIAARYEAGENFSSIGRSYFLCGPRIKQIVLEVRAALG